MITYVPLRLNQTAVFLAGKRVGTIDKTFDGWTYTPKGQKESGDTFPTLSLCKQSLEGN